MTSADVSFRDQARPADGAAVRRILESTGFFYEHETAVAVELVDERLAKGEASGYHFLFAEDAGGNVLGYTCFGPIACTVGSFDLFWIAVHNDCRGQGLGQRLLRETERRTAGMGGRRIYIETSGRDQYEPTRAFYRRCGYVQEAVLAEFYGPGDDKTIYVKALGA